MKLQNKVAIITGGAGGIGAAMVESYVAEGAKVAIADIALADAQQTAARHGDKAFAVQIDVSKIASIEAAMDAVVARWGGVDILVNNAGVFDMGPIVEVSEASWDKVFSVGLSGISCASWAVEHV
jgi:D-sorbitol dehydrogenase (acceptor)